VVEHEGNKMSDITQFNIWDEQGVLLCPACGFGTELQIPQYIDDGGQRIFICEACLWEPGFDDGDATSADEVRAYLREYRGGWNGEAPWNGSGDPPSGWNGERQLAHLFNIAPHVR
jgi:hypothetical protein